MGKTFYDKTFCRLFPFFSSLWPNSFPMIPVLLLLLLLEGATSAAHHCALGINKSAQAKVVKVKKVLFWKALVLMAKLPLILVCVILFHSSSSFSLLRRAKGKCESERGARRGEKHIHKLNVMGFMNYEWTAEANEFRVIWGQSPAVKITARKASTKKSVFPFSILLCLLCVQKRHHMPSPHHKLATFIILPDKTRRRSVSGSWRESSMNPHNDNTGRVDTRVGNEMTHKAAASQHEADIFSQIVRVIRGSAHTFVNV